MARAYVLHRRRYRESSLIVDLLCDEHGRVAAVARGALSGRGRLGATLQPAQPLEVTLRGRGELLTLVAAEAVPAEPLQLDGPRLYSLLYLNELVVRLTAVHDPNPRLFEAYRQALCVLGVDGPLEPALRGFETTLLDAIGFGLDLEADAAGEPLQEGRVYSYVPDRGAAAEGAPGGVQVHGATLLALAGRAPLDAVAAREAKRLMRHVIDHHLDGRPLAARALFETPRGTSP